MPSEEKAALSRADDREADLESVPLTGVERSAAASLGLLAAVTGSWAVFKTENQAGSAVLILAGAAFCLMGLQGTPLIRFGSGDNSLELERRRRRDRVKIAVQAAESTQELEAIVEGASLLDPSIVNTPYWQSQIYETRVMLVFKSMGAIVIVQNSDTSSADFVVRWRAGDEAPSLFTNRIGKAVEISLRYLGEGQKLKAPNVPRREGKVDEYATPLIVVTNAPISAALREKISDGDIGIADAVTWNTESDNPGLAKAIKRAVNLPE